MTSSRSSSGAVVLALAVLLASGLGASVQREVRRQSIHVVAVKDSGVLTMCPALRETTMAGGRTWRPDGRAIVRPFGDDLQHLFFPKRESAPDERRASRELRADPRFRTELSGTLAILALPRTAADPSAIAGGTELGRDFIATDRALQEVVERELTRLGTYAVASSVAGADLVLLIEGTYTALASYSTRESGKPNEAPPTLVAAAQPGDWQRNLLQSVLAIVMPGDVYRANPGDIPALLSARIWEGSEVAQSPYRLSEPSGKTGVTRIETNWTWQSASPAAVVWQFAGMKARPASHPPLCAATSQIFQLPAAPSSAPVVPVVSAEGTRPAVSTPTGFESPTAFKSGVTYVSVPVTVNDAEGRIVEGLDPSRFRIYEDDTIQTIDRLDRPGERFNVALLVDTSSSMRRKVDDIQAATAAAVKAFSRIGATAMVSFDRRVLWHSKLPDVRGRTFLDTNPPTPGRTATRLYDALDLLLSGPLKATSARTALVILTDGVDTASRLADAETARRRLEESHIPAYVIQYDTSQESAPVPPDAVMGLVVNSGRPDLTRRLVPEGASDPRPAYARATEFVRQIAEISGGRLIAAPSLEDLENTFAGIASELSQQYTLAYYPSNQARDGTYRRIRVEVDRPDVKVRARAGYFQALTAGVPRRH